MRPFTEVTFRISDGADGFRPVHIRIDKPSRLKTGEWSCNVSATGIAKRTAIHGEDPLQALCLALEYLGEKLYDARKRGLRLWFGTGDEVPLHAYFRLREARRRLAAIGKRHGRHRS